MRKVNLFFKRCIDLTGSGVGLILVLPVLFTAIIFIKITMPGPIFFTQKRVGKDRKEFIILKLRTMKVDREAEKSLDFSRDKERLTTTGKNLRRTKIDELPQLINVLKGDMSLVGPRPTVMKHVENYKDYQLQRFKMRPGMTGLAQVKGNITLPWEQRIEYDIEYIRKFSIVFDFLILIKTIAIVIFGEKKFKDEKAVQNNKAMLNDDSKSNRTLGG